MAAKVPMKTKKIAEVDILKFYNIGYTIDEIAQKLYAQKHSKNPEYLAVDARVEVERAVLEGKRRKNK